MSSSTKKSFLVYYDNEIIICRLSDDEAGKLFKSLFPYAKEQIKPDFENSPALAMAFDVLSMAIDRDLERYTQRCERNRENGRKGGLAKATNYKQSLPSGKQGLANLADRDRDKDKDMDMDSMKNTLCAPDGAQKGSRQEINDLFERVWKLYPNKKGKGQVSDSKKKELYRVGYEELSRAIDRYKEGLKADEWRKPQNGSTFFNRGYIDYLDCNYEGQQAHNPERPHYVSEYAQEEEEFMKGVKWDGPFK